MPTINWDENLIKERQENKKELNELEGLIFQINKCLKDGSIKLENGEATALLNNVTTYLGIRHKTIETREKEYDEDLKKQFEENVPKSFT